MSQVRVCEVVKTLDIGGVEVLLVDRLLRTSGTCVDYTVLCLRASTGELIGNLRAAGITVIDLTSCPRPLAYARMITTIRRLSPDVLNMHSPLPAAVLRPFLRLIRGRPRLVSTVHLAHRPTAVLTDRLKTGLTMFLDRLTRHLDDQTIAVSSLVAESAAVRGARRVAIRIHGVDVTEQRHWSAHADQVRREFGVPEGSFLVACVANFRPQKNHRMLIHAADEVVRTRSDALFLLAGDGPLRDEVVRDVSRRGLDERVRVLGPVPQAKRLVAAADLLVLSSHYEGLPVVVMEALAAGVPVVSTSVGGVPELITPGVNGLLTKPGSAHDLAAAILKAMAPAMHRSLRSGAAAGSATLDAADTAAWFEDLYTELATKGRSLKQPAVAPTASTAIRRRTTAAAGATNVSGRSGAGAAPNRGENGGEH